MIVEIIVGAGLVMAGAAAARALIRRKPDEPPPDPGPKKKSGRPGRPESRGLRVGDVLLYDETELWLAGMIELDEEGLAARLFCTPGSRVSDWLAQLDERGSDLAILRATDEVPDGPVPESLPIDGRRLALERRGQAVVRSAGEHLPRSTERASYAILSDAGGRVLVVVDFGKESRLALRGERIARHMVDLLPGGDLDPT